MEKEVNEFIEELLKESLYKIGVINVEVSPFATNIGINFNERYIKEIADFINGDKDKIQEIIRRHANDLGQEISNYIKSCNNKIDEEQQKIFDDLLCIFGIKNTK